jgi:hypothetical protein
MAVLAILTSRAEALVLASMLEAAGFLVHIDGEYHASANPISVALGGHRLRVPAWQHAEASALVRELDLPAQQVSYKGGQQAVVRLFSVYLGCQFFWAIPAAIGGLFPWIGLLGIAVFPLGIPVDPRGKPDWHLAEPVAA